MADLTCPREAVRTIHVWINCLLAEARHEFVDADDAARRYDWHLPDPPPQIEVDIEDGLIARWPEVGQPLASLFAAVGGYRQRVDDGADPASVNEAMNKLFDAYQHTAADLVPALAERAEAA